MKNSKRENQTFRYEKFWKQIDQAENGMDLVTRRTEAKHRMVADKAEIEWAAYECIVRPSLPQVFLIQFVDGSENGYAWTAARPANGVAAPCQRH